MRKLRGQQGDYRFNSKIRTRMSRSGGEIPLRGDELDRVGGEIPLRGDELDRSRMGGEIPLRGDELDRVRGTIRMPYENKPTSMSMTNAMPFKKQMTCKNSGCSGGIKKVNGVVMGDIKRPL